MLCRIPALAKRAALALGVCLFGIPTGALAAEQCPFIRPPGLSVTQVDALVLAKLGEVLQKDPIAINKARTIKALDRTDDAILRYALFVVAVADSLGFDSAAAFYAKARAKGSEQPYASVTVEEFQAISREKYLQGTDSPPPAVPLDAEYQIGRISVRAPSRPTDWLLLRCTNQQVVFQRRGGSRELTTAVAGSLSLPAFEGPHKFAQYTRSVVSANLSSLGHIRSLEVTPEVNTPMPCVLVEASVDRDALLYAMHARYCYRDERAGLGYYAMFSHNGTTSKDKVRAEAMAFLAGIASK
jgi:hypothetical protein